MVSRRMMQVGKWSRRIGGGALVLALVGLSAPATTSARIYEDETPEEIEIEDDAPLSSPWWHGSYTGGSGSSSGGSAGGGGGGGSSSGGSTSELRLAAAKDDCTILEGSWGPAVFNDYVTDIRYSGYSCRLRFPNRKYVWRYYDSEGYYNHQCEGDLDVQICEQE